MKQVALITGASRGIGAAIAEAFAGNGYHLALCCHKSAEQLHALSEKLSRTYRIQIRCFVGDVGDCEFVQDMISATMEEFGQIDVLINNAGISYIGLLTDMSVDDWNRIVATNLSSAFLTSRLCVPQMVARKSGHIINISSVWGSVGASCEVAYSASKGAVNSFTKALAKELAPSNIAVNAIAFGAIDTEMNAHLTKEDRALLEDEIPYGKMATPKEAATFAKQILSMPSYFTGEIVKFDGAWI